MAATAAILAATVAAGGASIASAALGSKGGTTQTSSSTTGVGRLPETDPVVAYTSFDALLGLGIVDPTILMRASPIANAVDNFQRIDPTLAFGGGLATQGSLNLGTVSQALVQAYELWTRDPEGFAKEIAEPLLRQVYSSGKGGGPLGFFPGSPFGGEGASTVTVSNKGRRNLARADAAAAAVAQQLDQLFREEQGYRARIEPILNKARLTADEVFGARLSAQEQAARLVQSLPNASAQGLEATKEAEKARLLRDLNQEFDIRSQDQLRAANFGGFNPGRGLGELEKERLRQTQNADQDALGRAVALISGQQQAAGNELTLLQQFLQGPQAQAQGLSSIRTGAGFGGAVNQSSAQGASQGATQLPQTIETAGSNLATALLLSQNPSPAAPRGGGGTTFSVPSAAEWQRLLLRP